MPGVKVRSFVPKVKAKIDREVKDVISRAVIAYTNEVKRLMLTSPRGGRVYRVSKAGVRRPRFHKASAPGEPPAVNTGQLVKSISFKITMTPKGIEALAGSSLKKAVWLEYGTRGKNGVGRIAPRPAWRPALVTARNIIAKFKLSRPRGR